MTVVAAATSPKYGPLILHHLLAAQRFDLRRAVPQRAQDRVGQGVSRNIGVGMAAQTPVMGNLNAAQNQPSG